MKKAVFTMTLALILASGIHRATGCTNFLITRGASVDGSTFISYSADSHVLYGELYYWPAATYPEGAMLDVYEWDTGEYMGKIKQVRQTYNVTGNMNEYGVALGETTYGGLESLQKQPGAIMDYGSMMYLALQRAKTAREAIKVMTDLVAEYGYASEGESISVSDPDEVWIFEIIGKGEGQKGAVWVARRIPDGYICGHANHPRITTFPKDDPDNCLYAPDVISFARTKNLFSGKDEEFSFSDTYAPVDFGGARFCEIRVWAMFRQVNSGMDQYLDYVSGKNLKHRMPLWIKPERKISVEDMMDFMRDHLEGTPFDMRYDLGAGPYDCPYRWRPMTWSVDGVDYLCERATCTQQTGFSFIAQSRSWMPQELRGVFWFSVDDAASTVYFPMYTSSTRVPEAYAKGNGAMMDFTFDSGFWVFNLVSNFAYTRYRDIHPEIRAKQTELENRYVQEVGEVDKKARELLQTDRNAAIAYLTDYSVKTGNETVSAWQELFKYLFTRYMDGNIKERNGDKQNPIFHQPGYGEGWYRRIAEDTGDRLKIIGPAGH
jgi:dipeptidase